MTDLEAKDYPNFFFSKLTSRILRMGPSFSAISMQAGNCSEGKCTISVPMLDFEINQTPLVIALCSVETVTVTVDLQDVNDNVPFFTSSPSRMNYPENAIGIIEHQICGSDLDKADVPNLMCSVLINEIPSQNFGMVSGQNSNGNEKCFQIEVLKALDFEEQTTYLLEIFLSDGLFNASTYVPLIVDDRPDQPPQWSRFPSIISFPEDTQVGHVIAVFVARDGDLGINQPIRYELREGNENIELSPETGNLTLVKQIDRDVNGAESYVLEFEIFAIEDDNSSEGITGDILMTVTDVNDNIPTYSHPGPYAVLVSEGTVGNIIFDHFIEVADRDFSTSPVPETAGQLYGASGSNTNRIESSLHAKAKNQSHVGVADENRPKNGTSSLSLKEN
ncbi:hypothetical protein QYM36_000030 [Artemia franciscana]|uniref:Cadherin domain-containing protein n=1 Tax=Artemia franciscana TaxID=6661 RepID=A0AA88IKE9_ARTSF|nr:hypothetical protein QYM36_000030 [Artemia franciscana]